MKTEGLINQLVRGDETALKDLYEQFSGKIYGFCLNNGIDKEDAKDVVQEVFIRLWNQRSDLKISSKPESYIFSIARNIVVDRYRLMLKNKVAIEYQIYLMTPKNDTESAVYFQELKDEIEKTFDSMPEVRKLVFQLSRFKGYTNQEIADQLGISVRTVESHISKALQVFRRNLRHSSAMITLLLLQSFL